MEDLPAGKRACLYDATQMGAVMDSMARQAAVLLYGCSKVAIVGILRRGAPLADRLTQLLVEKYQ